MILKSSSHNLTHRVIQSVFLHVTWCVNSTSVKKKVLHDYPSGPTHKIYLPIFDDSSKTKGWNFRVPNHYNKGENRPEKSDNLLKVT